MSISKNIRVRMIICLSLAFTIIYFISAQDSEQYRGPAGDTEHLEFARVNGVELAYRMEGAGFPVIFLHGEPGSHEQWALQMEAFSKNYLFISYDRRGNGSSEAPVYSYSPRAHAEDLNQLMNFLGIQESHFVVHSRSGMIILIFLKKYPGKVRSIIFADAMTPLVKLPPLWDHIIQRRLTEPIPSLKEVLVRREARKHLPGLRVARSMPHVREILDRMVDQYSPRIYLTPQRSDITSPLDIGPWNNRDFPDMTKMYHPILLLVGELTDPLFSEGSKEASELWPNTRHHIIPGTDHLPMLEAPEEFNRLSLEFLSGVDDRRKRRDKWIGQVP
jgi:pimeloyl-ACP methyl ester carboxylesterase